jgi:hypothetical protein
MALLNFIDQNIQPVVSGFPCFAALVSLPGFISQPVSFPGL